MKNYIFLTLCVFVSVFSSCNQEKKEKPACIEKNANCEAQKPWHIMKVVSLRDTNSMDAFGDKLQIGKFYVRNAKTKMFFCVAFPSENEGWLPSPTNLEKLGTPDNAENDCRILRTAKLDTTISMLAGYYDIVCAVVCLDNSEITLSNYNKHQHLYWIDYK